MTRLHAHLLTTAALIGLSAPALAQRQTAVGPGIIPLDATGVLNGVSMSGSAATGVLSVGVIGGPEMDVFTANSALNPGQVAISTDASSQASIVFNSSSTVYGAIGVTQPGGPFFLNISGGNTGTNVNFLGPVYATTLTVLGTGNVNFESGSTNITATNFAADGTISLSPNTTVIGALTTTAGADTGTLAMADGSVLNGAVGGAIGLKNITVTGGSVLAGSTATITGAADAFTFTLGTNTLNIGGALTIANLAASGVINTELASPTIYGNIRPLGATNLGPALAVDVTVPASAYFPVGTQFNIIKTQAGTLQSGTNGSVVSVTVEDPTNPLYHFVAIPAAGTIAGQVTIDTTSIPLLAPVPTPVLPVVPILIGLAPNPVVTPIVTAIDTLTSPAAVAAALATLTPSVTDLAAARVTFQGVQSFEDLLGSRMDDITCGEISRPNPATSSSTCQPAQPQSGWWLKGFGNFGDQGSSGGYAGYNFGTVGTMIAYDTPIFSDWAGETRVGLGLGVARTTMAGTSGSAQDPSTEFSTYKAMGYIGHEQGPWFINGDLSFGWDAYSGERSIALPGIYRTANANYQGQDYTAYTITGYHFELPVVTLTPLASLQYTHLNLANYAETGAGALDLRVASQSYDFIESGLGGKISHDFVYARGSIVPEIHAKWLYALDNPSMRNSAAFSVADSPSFTTPGLGTSANTYNIGTGFTILSCACTGQTWSLEAVYDYFWQAQGYHDQQGMLKFTGRF